MRIPKLGLEGDLNTVVIVGAGASRGASCVQAAGIVPPMDSDFFAQAQRMASVRLTRGDRELFSFIREEFGQEDLPTLEVFFTQISAIHRFHHDFNIRGRPSGRFSKQLTALKKLIPRVFSEALKGRNCIWHERLAYALRSSDAIISFNYDLLIDRALTSVGGNRWIPTTGYGFESRIESNLWKQNPYKGPAVRNPIMLLKPHGSLNWKIDTSAREVLLVDEYCDETVESIVPPTWDKSDVINWPWSEVWRTSRTVLGRARLLVVIGYSVPVTDQLSQALLRADLAKVKALIVVNPDEIARKRTIDLISSALDANAVVIELRSFEEFASYLPASPTEPLMRDLGAEIRELSRYLNTIVRRFNSIINSEADLERTIEKIRDEMEEIVQRLEDVESRDPDEGLERLEAEIREVDARLDSFTSS